MSCRIQMFQFIWILFQWNSFFRRAIGEKRHSQLTFRAQAQFGIGDRNLSTYREVTQKSKSSTFQNAQNCAWCAVMRRCRFSKDSSEPKFHRDVLAFLPNVYSWLQLKNTKSFRKNKYFKGTENKSEVRNKFNRNFYQRKMESQNALR